MCVEWIPRIKAGYVLVGTVLLLLFLLCMPKSYRYRVGKDELSSRLDENDAELMNKMKRLSQPSTAQDDRELVSLIRHQVIEEPRPFRFKHSFPLYETPQAAAVRKLFKAKKGGFFVECGALDGERSSNTITLEHQLQWTGLLIEMDPSWYLQLRGKNRRCYTANCCLSTRQYPMITTFEEHEKGGGRLTNRKSGNHLMMSRCFPLYSMMLAVNTTTIDYLSLDVEGKELSILKTIPWGSLDIKVLSVEYVHGNKQALVKYMLDRGYTLHKTIDASKPSINLYAHDVIFVKNGFVS